MPDLITGSAIARSLRGLLILAAIAAAGIYAVILRWRRRKPKRPPEELPRRQRIKRR